MPRRMVYKNMLLPLDGSKEAEKRIAEAVSLIKLTEGELILLHVIELTPFLPRDREAEYRMLKEKAEEYLNEIKTKVESEGVKVRVVIKEGKPASEICDYAERDDVDVVLVSPYGWSGIVAMALGSVADKVVRNSPKPVLVIRQSIE